MAGVDFSDPFREAREEGPVLKCSFQGEDVPMILGHADLRAAAKDWQTFSSDAPFRVPIPSEESMRTMRQLPIEHDPPEHGEYRKLVEPFFKRARLPEVIESVDSLIAELIDDALSQNEIEIVRGFALPLQSRGLTYLLNVPESEAETWIGWGIHVFHDGEKGNALEDYLHAQFDKAGEGDDFFSAMTQATYQGNPLTRDEQMGFANLAFAGGRDTVIHTVSSVIAYFAEHPEALTELRDDPKKLVHASEEFFRVISPLTHIGRVCPVATDVHGATVPEKGRVSLAWAAANKDPAVFENPEDVQLARKPNPHLAFGFGAHLCLGAAHARLILRSLLGELSQRVSAVTVLSEEKNVEKQAHYTRSVGYQSLKVRLTPAQEYDRPA
ncbi:cytochrome P450 [Akkermansiaceae bacterium]|nr:cytochrome P450 [Akkermansiaceae bacterium]MDB4274815.1 cytochrome P450 [Akkermansiaceae bacterium]MDB4433729.1 cytochrome P450 [Akkermansiaceae bacterium]